MAIPDFSTLNRLEEAVLSARLEAVRASLTHSGEKGRALEQCVFSLLRSFLPAEYGITTGFIVSLDEATGPQLSRQLDIIIYDAIRHSPLIRLDSCDVLPLEAVYGYVEVKATLTSTSDSAMKPAENSVESCISKNVEMRQRRTRAFNITHGGSPIHFENRREYWLAPRAYIVAFEPEGAIAKDPDLFAGRMAEVLDHHVGAHIHGILMPSHGFFYTRAVDADVAVHDDYSHVIYTTDHTLLAFKSILLQGLATFPRPPDNWAPAIDQYLNHNGQWREKVPTKKTSS